MPHVAVSNASKLISDDEIKVMLPAFAKQWNDHLAPVWHVAQCDLRFYSDIKRAPKDAWWLNFLDETDQAEALGYHDLTPQGQPLSKVFVKALKAYGGSPSICASHELCEMAVDPFMNYACMGHDQIFWCNEICDPVEDDRYGYAIGKVMVSDFVTPEWYKPPHADGPYDYCQHLKQPYQVLPQGYAQCWDPAKLEWHQLEGAQAHRSARRVAGKGSRRDRRQRGAESWTRSELG